MLFLYNVSVFYSSILLINYDYCMSYVCSVYNYVRIYYSHKDYFTQLRGIMHSKLNDCVLITKCTDDTVKHFNFMATLFCDCQRAKIFTDFCHMNWINLPNQVCTIYVKIILMFYILMFYMYILTIIVIFLNCQIKKNFFVCSQKNFSSEKSDRPKYK